ncbi:MAG TPA: bifunctional DNA-formamidopyrimidine glycosylase/DNA-(apurinic or apyrimidinic site) lyase [Terriglobia bacterium]|nr:bifunctional DNA-formamidopyrimidine glycosylase/DNA-(apurinic or apyrimidinic site) lyase [Terriglobia bacterium]
MPELPEVETVLRGLKARVLGRRLTEVEVSNPQVIHGNSEDFVAGIAGRRIQALRRKGKALAMELSARSGEAANGGCFLVVRLGMTGQLVVVPREASLEPHTHVRLALEGGTEEIRYQDARRFGRLRCSTRRELESIFARLGPDAPDISEEEFLGALQARRGAVKGWLMNQQRLAGLGNIYADEALFEARIHPLAQPGRLPVDAARRLHRAVKKILKRAVELQGTSFRDYIDIEGRPGNYLARLRVYQRTGEPCRRCRTPIRRIVIAGRSSHFCPKCQPRPRGAALATRRKTSR